MTEYILEKLEVLDKQAKILGDGRAKKTMFLTEQRVKSSATPLVHDLHKEFEDAEVTSIPKATSKITEDKLCDLNKPKKLISFKYEPEVLHDFAKSNLKPQNVATSTEYQKKPAEEIPKPRSAKPLYYLKDTSEAEDAKLLDALFSQYREERRQPPGSSGFSALPSNHSIPCKKIKGSDLPTAQSKSRLKRKTDSTVHFAEYVTVHFGEPTDNKTVYALEMNDASIQENRPVGEDEYYRARSLFPLCFEDELKSPNVKIINVVGPVKTKTSFTEQSHSNPIVFYNPIHIKRKFLQENRFAPHILPHDKKNFVLERNCNILKSLVSDKPTTVRKPQESPSTAWRKGIQAIAYEVIHKNVKESVKKKNASQASDKKPWGTLYNLSQTLSSLTKKVVGYFDKNAIQEKNINTGEPERTFSCVKPRHVHKSNVLPISYTKPLKNILDIRKLNNVTPLDDLLSFRK